MSDERFVIKSEAARQIGMIVYEANVADCEGDFCTAETIHKGLLSWAAAGFPLKLDHSEDASGKAFVFEVFQPEARTKVGKFTLNRGDLYAGVQITDDGLWQDILDGKFRGASMAGTAKSRPSQAGGVQ